MLPLLMVTVFVLLVMMTICNAGYVKIAGAPPGANPVISELAMDNAVLMRNHLVSMHIEYPLDPRKKSCWTMGQCAG